MSQWIEKQDNPFEVFKTWFESAQMAGNFESTAMTLATVDQQGLPDARVVLLKEYDSEGMCFYTNYESRKGTEIAGSPKGALVFHWEKPLHRQIRLRGTLEKLSYERSNAYFQSRPRGSQIGAWSSPQSQEIQSRAELEKRVAEMEQRFSEGEIPCPQNWGGYILKPLSFEFWQAQEFRLHDRMIFERKDLRSPWTARRLAP